MIWLFLLKRWRIALVGLLVAGIAGAIALHIRHDNKQVAALAKAAEDKAWLVAELAAKSEALGKLLASTQAADEARARNDEVIPRIRADTQGRVDRAPTADLPTRLQDVAAALAADAAADRAVHGTKPD